MNNEIAIKVLDVYRTCKVDTVPLDCFKILEEYGYRIFTYGELRQSNNELYKLCKSYSNDAFIHRVFKIAAYNEQNSSFRIRFSLMHELGHIVLDSNDENDANCFASHVIAPRILIHKYRCTTSDQIHDRFGLSYQASNSALISYKKWFNSIACSKHRHPSEYELQLEYIFFPKETPPPNAVRPNCDDLDEMPPDEKYIRIMRILSSGIKMPKEFWKELDFYRKMGLKI